MDPSDVLIRSLHCAAVTPDRDPQVSALLQMSAPMSGPPPPQSMIPNTRSRVAVAADRVLVIFVSSQGVASALCPHPRREISTRRSAGHDRAALDEKRAGGTGAALRSTWCRLLARFCLSNAS